MEPREMSLIRYVTRIHFADRVLEDALPEEVLARGIAAPLVLTDTATGEALPRLLDALPPTCRPQVAAAERLVATGLPEAACDAAIGLGGRLALDLARIVPCRGGAAAPRMAVPTLPGCLGFGPVVARARRAGLSPRTVPAPFPDVVFCDPALLLLAPRGRLAASGMDVLVRCLEALLSSAWNPPADAMAFDGLRRAGAWAERLASHPEDGEARCEVFAAGLNGALAGQKGLGAIHALAHAIEDMTGAEAGRGSLHAALVGPVLAFNAPAVPDRIASAADALRLPGPEALAGHLAAIGARLGLPPTLRHLGLTPADIARLAAAAAEDCANRTNPRMATTADYRAMIEAAL
jgi:alcohol dehydrogenase class IV